jgi:hypothetical protein
MTFATLSRILPAALASLTALAVLSMSPGLPELAAVPAPADDPACAPVERMPVEGRASPLDSAQVALGGGMVKICYGSPSLRGRTMLGGEAVPYGQLWRFGANEPTTLHTTVPLSVGGVRVPEGSVALYAIPGAGHWEIFITASTGHWGLQITPEVRAQELGSFHVDTQTLESPVESMVLRFEDAGTRGATLVFEWQTTRFSIPVTATSS